MQTIKMLLLLFVMSCHLITFAFSSIISITHEKDNDHTFSSYSLFSLNKNDISEHSARYIQVATKGERIIKPVSYREGLKLDRPLHVIVLEDEKDMITAKDEDVDNVRLVNMPKLRYRRKKSQSCNSCNIL